MLEDEDKLQCSIQILFWVAAIFMKNTLNSLFFIYIFTLFSSSLYIYLFPLVSYKCICLNRK